RRYRRAQAEPRLLARGGRCVRSHLVRRSEDGPARERRGHRQGLRGDPAGVAVLSVAGRRGGARPTLLGWPYQQAERIAEKRLRRQAAREKRKLFERERDVGVSPEIERSR